MSGTFPTDVDARNIRIVSFTPTMVSTSHSLKIQSRSRGTQRWSIEAEYPLMSRTAFAPIWAFIQKQKGKFGTFQYIPSIYKDSNGNPSGTLSVNNVGGYSAGDSTLAVDGMAGSLKAGDFIKFAGHDKVYAITADATTSLEIEPPLLEAVADDEVVTYNDVPFTVSISTDSNSQGMSINQLTAFSISLIEVV